MQRHEISEPKAFKTYAHALLYSFYIIPVAFSVTQIVVSVLLSFSTNKDYEVLNPHHLLIKTIILFLLGLFPYLFFCYRTVKKLPASKKIFYPCLILSAIWFIATIPFVDTLNGYWDRSVAQPVEYIVERKLVGKNESFVLLLSKGKESDKRKPSWEPPFPLSILVGLDYQ